MIKKIALLAAALTLTVPAFAQSSASTPAAISDAKPAKKHHHKSHKKATEKKEEAAK